ncbi:MAG: hypothetical protein V7K41_08215 [Nostoc sp.]|uniref:hypothetical protein n=1 Tax=Nostoc sp. TaxID=1180 RepID=UPI002FFCB0EB
MMGLIEHTDLFRKPSRESKAIVAVVLQGVDISLLQNWQIGDFLGISLCYTNFHLVKPFNSA